MRSGNAYKNMILESGTKLLIPQKIPKGYNHSYYTFAALFEGSNISWQEFRKKYIKNGGDGIYAAWQTVNNEPVFLKARKKGLYSGSMKISDSYGFGDVPVAEKIQKKIMQFTTNQKNDGEIKKQLRSLKKTLNYFE